MLFVNKHQIFTFVTTEKTEENFSSSTAQETVPHDCDLFHT